MILKANGVTNRHPQVRQHTVKQQHHHIPIKSSPSYGNQRIIKIHGTSKVNSFNGQHKHIRSRPIGFPKGNTKEDFVGSKHHSSPSFFNGPSTNHIKHLAGPPPHVYHKSPSYGVAYPYQNLNTFRTSLVKSPFRTFNSAHVKQTSFKQKAQSSAVTTQVTPVSQVSKKTKTSATGSSNYSPVFTGFSQSSGISHHVVSSDGNNGPIKEVPAPDLGPKSVGVGLLLGSGQTPHLAPSFFNGFKDLSGGNVDPIIKTPSIDLTALINNPPLNSNHFLQGSGEGFTSGGLDHATEAFNLEQESSVDEPNILKVTIESEKPGLNYEVTEHHHLISTNDHILKSHDGTKYYYAPDPDPSLPVYKVPPTKDPHSTPSHGQSTNIYIPQISNAFAYVQNGGLSNPVAAVTSEELYHLMQGYPTVLSQLSRPINFIGHSQSTGSVSSPQSYYPQIPNPTLTNSHPEVGDITQYLQNPEIHNLLHNTLESQREQESQYSPSQSYSVQVDPNIYASKNQYKTNFQTSSYSYDDASSKTLGPQVFDVSESNGEYEPEASESRNNVVTVTRQTDKTSETSENDSLPEDIDSNELNFSATEEKIQEEPQVYHFKNFPEVPLYTSLPSEEAAKILAELQAAGSVVNSYLQNTKAPKEDLKNDEEENTNTEEAEDQTVTKDLSNTGFYRFSGFKKLNDRETESKDVDGTSVQEVEDQTGELTGQSNDDYLGGDRSALANHKNQFIQSAAELIVPEEKEFSQSQDQESEKLTSAEFSEDSFDATFGKKIRPK